MTEPLTPAAEALYGEQAFHHDDCAVFAFTPPYDCTCTLADHIRAIQAEARATAEADFVMIPARLLSTEWPPNDGLMPGSSRFDEMLESVQREGIREPLTVNLKWVVIDGNHRLAVARHLGLVWIPVRFWNGVEYVPSTTRLLAAPPTEPYDSPSIPMKMVKAIDQTYEDRKAAVERGEP